MSTRSPAEAGYFFDLLLDDPDLLGLELVEPDVLGLGLDEEEDDDGFTFDEEGGVAFGLVLLGGREEDRDVLGLDLEDEDRGGEDDFEVEPEVERRRGPGETFGLLEFGRARRCLKSLMARRSPDSPLLFARR